MRGHGNEYLEHKVEIISAIREDYIKIVKSHKIYDNFIFELNFATCGEYSEDIVD